MNPENCHYTKGHTWVRVENGLAAIGVTDYAQEQLGKVLFVETKSRGDRITQFQPCGAVESDKATADVMSPVSGEVVEVNDDALDRPELLNEDPYGKGWLLKVRLANRDEFRALMSAREFEDYIASK